MFEIGDEEYPGLSKIVEESGEVLQIIGKLINSLGNPQHFDGSNLRKKLINELADLDAALEFFIAYGLSQNETELLNNRMEEKFNKFKSWHEEILDERASTC